jgi:hypothetical protein
VSARKGRASAALLLAVGLLASASYAGPAAASDPNTCPVEVEGRVGTWIRRPAPPVPSGSPRITAHAVDPRDGGRHLITDGLAILRTDDDGCRWEVTYRLPDEAGPALAASSETDRIHRLVVHPTQPDRVWAVVAVGQEVADQLDNQGLLFLPASRARRDLTATLVLRSDDGGRTWAPMHAPTLLPGAPVRLAPAPSDPDVAYLSVNGALFVTTDGGMTWLPRPLPAVSPTAPVPPYELFPLAYDLAVHPDDAEVLLARTQVHALRSDDGGHTWTELPPPITNHPTGPFVDPWRTDEHGARALYVHQHLADSYALSFLRYREEPGDLQVLPVAEDEVLLGAPLAASWHPTRDEVLLATWQNNIPSDRFDRVSLYLVDLSVPREGEPEARFTDVDELGLSPLRGVDVDLGGTYHVHDLEELVSLRVDADVHGRPALDADVADRCDDAGVVPPLQAARPSSPAPAVLDAAGPAQVPTGGAAEVPVTLELPATPGAVDVYLLLDTSNGFRGDIGDVARGLAAVTSELAQAGVDAQFGLGGLGTGETYRYRRFVDIGPAGEALRQGLSGLCARGGHEAHLVSLHQTATGSGVPDGGRLRPEVPPGQDPTWRDGSLRTVVVVTDNEFDDRTPRENDPDAPPRQEIFDALAARDIHVLGIEIVRDVTTPAPIEGQEGTPGWLAAVEAADAAGRTAPTPARQDLEAVARATGTFAPAGGVDCRGTGRTELREGDPLVCTTFSTVTRLAGESTMADVLRRVLLAQQELQPVEVVVADAGGLDVEVRAPEDPRVDVRRDHVGDDALRYPMTVRCPAARDGEAVEVSLVATVAGAAVATTTISVTCGGSPVVPPVDGPTAPTPGEPAIDPGPAEPNAFAAAPPGGAPPGTVPVAGTAPAPGSAAGQAPALGQSPVTGQSPVGGQAAAPGTAPGTASAAASGQAGVAAPGATVAQPAVGVAAAPGEQQRPQVAGATVALGDSTLASSEVRPRTAHGPAPVVWHGAAAASFASALVLGTRRSSVRASRPRR